VLQANVLIASVFSMRKIASVELSLPPCNSAFTPASTCLACSGLKLFCPKMSWVTAGTGTMDVL
jgi:hypothetical protein